MRRALLLGTLLIAQMGPDGVAVRCWVLPGVPTSVTDSDPRWLSRDPAMGGWMMWVAVQKNDLDAAARAVRMKSAKECKV